MRALRLALPLLVLAGCSKPGGYAVHDSPNPAAAAKAETVAGEPAKPSAADAIAQGAVAPSLAYSYAVTLSAPAGALPALMQGHDAACAAAGPAVCQVVSSQLTRAPEGGTTGELDLRAEPRWLAAFRARLEPDARRAGGRLQEAKVETEDLSRDLVDGEARLRATATLRDRLQALLASHPGKLSDLLDVERELARVQGELDAATSELAVLRGRVQMSTLKVSYTGPEGAGAGAGSVWAPLGRALEGAPRATVETLAALVTVLAVLAPAVVAVALITWIVVAVRRRRRPRPATPPPAPLA